MTNNDWIKCSERLPENGDYYTSKRFMIWVGYIEKAIFMNHQWIDNPDNLCPKIYHPTHWSELPKPPEDL